jgi:hypothetical protein
MEQKVNCAKSNLEHKHSLRRRYYLEGFEKNIWHIHGELEDTRNLSEGSKFYHEESIMIGYEHYSSYLEEIQKNIKGKSGVQKPEKQSLFARIKNGNNQFYWLDKFFTHNLDIVGLSFDFSENHLWWILNLRANHIRNKKIGKDLVIINNRIRFFYADLPEPMPKNLTFEKFDKFKNEMEKEKGIGDVLKAFCVDVVPVPCETREEFYELLITKHLLN